MLLPFALSLAGRLLRGPQSEQPKAPKMNRGRNLSQLAVMGRRVNVRFFLAVNIALALFAMMLLLAPLVSAREGSPIQVALAIFVITALGALVVLYANRKGDLGWLQSSFRQSPEVDRSHVDGGGA